jgi:hypothetical protein
LGSGCGEEKVQKPGFGHRHRAEKCKSNGGRG